MCLLTAPSFVLPISHLRFSSDPAQIQHRSSSDPAHGHSISSSIHPSIIIIIIIIISCRSGDSLQIVTQLHFGKLPHGFRHDGTRFAPRSRLTVRTLGAVYLPDLALSSARISARRYAFRAQFLHDGSHILRIQCSGGRPREWVSLRAQQHKKSHHGSACSMLFVTIGKTAKHGAIYHHHVDIFRHDLQ